MTVTHLDGLVLARSAFHHSMNYRSVVVLGRAEKVTDPDEKHRALDAIVDHVLPGRAADSVPPTTPSCAAPSWSACRSSRHRPRSAPARPSTSLRTSTCRTGPGRPAPGGRRAEQDALQLDRPELAALPAPAITRPNAPAPPN
ncbi:MAG: pyridoxamine 5'-phosphate oxidase family protein [Acidimicrobiales bacterium]